MKYIKTYEDVNIGKPESGDYVICKDSTDREISKFTKNAVGKMIKYDSEEEPFCYWIKYDKVPYDVAHKFTSNMRNFSREEIMHWSPDKEELEAILNSNKYNI